MKRTQIIDTKRTDGGYTLFELIITLTVLAVFVMGTVPIAQNAYKRQKEVRLRETLRMIRSAIDEFKRDSVGACPQGSITTGNPTRGPQAGAQVPTDPRSRVVIDDCTIFDSENIDRYPPSLEVLVDGVRVKQRGISLTGGSGLGAGTRQATEINDNETEEVTKVYLRELPIDPMTGETNWNLRSSYQPPGDDSWDSVNVFDVRSSSSETSLGGDKYSDW